MNTSTLTSYADLTLLPHDGGGLANDLQRPIAPFFTPGGGCDAGVTQDCMAQGARLIRSFPDPTDRLATAWASLDRMLEAKEIALAPDGYPIRFTHDPSLSREAYRVTADSQETVVTAGDIEGMRRAIYFLEDRLAEARGRSVMAGTWERRPVVEHRISRCFFGPTNREPFFIDELMNEVDYYPDAYLDKLAHEGINGLWLSVYFRDLPSSVFPGRGGDAPQRMAKLRQTAARCLQYGIRLYLFISEPKLYGDASYAVPLEDAATCPETVGAPLGRKFHTFCTSSEKGRRYLTESVTELFLAVPELGGLIHILHGEDNGSCISDQLHVNHDTQCPRCKDLDPARAIGELAADLATAMHRVNPEARYIGWIYAPGQRDHSPQMERLARIAEFWPAHASLMFNFESGGHEMQLGKERVVFDYSLAYVGPSALFEQVARRAPSVGAKLQVGCSHENASVPFIPVPGNLYEKYRTLHAHGVDTVMQCWYFGNYPGLMNKAAGELSFEPLPDDETQFLLHLARPDWREHAPQVVQAWQHFARGYRLFPANIAFAWFGPLHHSIVWPLHLFPTDTPLAPSWILKQFPALSGDRIGECLSYHHTLAEALALCDQMHNHWQRGADLLERLRSLVQDDAARQADIDLAQAIAIQIRSTCNVLRFYHVREAMLHDRQDRLAELRAIVLDEIDATHAMHALCLRDPRLGYHSEAEGYLFFPDKLAARARMLQALLEDDFARFDLDEPWVDQYTGRSPVGPQAVCPRQSSGDALPVGDSGIRWSSSHDDTGLTFRFEQARGKAVLLEIEPRRLWPALRVELNVAGQDKLSEFPLRQVPSWRCEVQGDDVVVWLPHSLLEGFVNPIGALRVNVSTTHQGSTHAWVKRDPWPSRLLHQDFNPASAGWLILDPA